MEELEKDKGDMEQLKGQAKRYPKGHFIGMGMGIGIPIGVVLGFIMNTIAIGIPIGVAIGVAIGSSLEAKYNKDPRPLTEAEKDIRKMMVWVGIIVLALGIVAFAIVYFFSM